MKITLLYQVSHYIRVKKYIYIKSWDQQNYLVIRGFCYIRPRYNEVPLYYMKTRHWKQVLVGLSVFSDGVLHFLQIKKKFYLFYRNYLVALINIKWKNIILENPNIQFCRLHYTLPLCKFLRRSRDPRPRSQGGAIMHTCQLFLFNQNFLIFFQEKGAIFFVRSFFCDYLLTVKYMKYMNVPFFFLFTPICSCLLGFKVGRYASWPPPPSLSSLQYSPVCLGFMSVVYFGLISMSQKIQKFNFHWLFVFYLNKQKVSEGHREWFFFIHKNVTEGSLFRTFNNHSFNFYVGLCNILCVACSKPVSWAVCVIFSSSGPKDPMSLCHGVASVVRPSVLPSVHSLQNASSSSFLNRFWFWLFHKIGLGGGFKTSTQNCEIHYLW